ncbi:hypothetical protein [Paenibacillus sp. FJAT-26967]|uniref:hypothetical protein n=1 Tax=Paenibacillus sp. FJAT-26967 TaxID=1729690 RepID=UPI0008385284|nr:hypothetical protein [Paenibacillus sp. FJAT-26967]
MNVFKSLLYSCTYSLLAWLLSVGLKFSFSFTVVVTVSSFVVALVVWTSVLHKVKQITVEKGIWAGVSIALLIHPISWLVAYALPESGLTLFEVLFASMFGMGTIGIPASAVGGLIGFLIAKLHKQSSIAKGYELQAPQPPMINTSQP